MGGRRKEIRSIDKNTRPEKITGERQNEMRIHCVHNYKALFLAICNVKKLSNMNIEVAKVKDNLSMDTIIWQLLFCRIIV